MLYYRVCQFLRLMHDVDDEAVDCLVQSNLITRAISVLDYLSSLLSTLKIIKLDDWMEEAFKFIPSVLQMQLEAFSELTVSEKVCQELLR